MLIAFAAYAVDEPLEHFGHAEQFAVYDLGSGQPTVVETRSTVGFCGNGLGPAALEEVVERLSDCDAVIAAAIGPCGQKALAEAGVEAIVFEGTLSAALEIITRRGLKRRQPQHHSVPKDVVQ